MTPNAGVPAVTPLSPRAVAMAEAQVEAMRGRCYCCGAFMRHEPDCDLAAHEAHDAQAKREEGAP